MQAKISPDEARQQLDEFLVKKQADPTDIAFQEAASVLVHFHPENLKPYQITLESDLPEWSNFFKYCDPVKRSTEGNLWELRPSVRRAALQRLGTKDNIVRALATNAQYSEGAEQKLLESVVHGREINMQSLRREHLVLLSEITEWFNNILPVSELRDEIQRAIPMADLLAPMRRLAGSSFVGRKKELLQLAEYVGIKPATENVLTAAGRFIRSLLPNLNENPPLLIYGPGGIGKSTLIGRFILDNVEIAGKPLPFAYLDTDRSILDPKEPQTYVIEAVRQLISQCPEQADALKGLLGDLQQGLNRYDQLESAKSFYYGDLAATRFGEIISKVHTPVLLVIDTFEEAQYLGDEVVHGFWTLLVELQKAAPNLRTIVGGRAKIEQFPIKELLLKELSREDAQLLISNGLRNSIKDAEQLKKITEDIISVAGLNPMSLRLSLTIVNEQGVEVLKKVETRTWYLQRLRTELVQARLYGRILAHIKNDNIKNLALPGMIVRRLNTEVIKEVLAGPCKLKLETPNAADELINILSREASLIERDTDGSLCHRQDVRRIMLNDLKQEVRADIIKQINDNAVKYYSAKDDVICRAEEIYHRLFRGDDTQEVEKRWMPGVENRLRNALEELPPNAILWLSSKLGVTPDKELLKSADLENWEEITVTRAQRYQQTGASQLALQALRERSERSLNSPLYRLELEVLRSIPLYEEAAFVADEMLHTIPKSTDPSIICELNIQAALAKEAMGQIDDAIAYIERAQKLREEGLTRESLRVLITHIRLLRKKGEEKNNERGELISTALSWLDNKTLMDSLRNNPALFREVVAELGKMDPELLQSAIDWAGIEIRNDNQAHALAEALNSWNSQLQKRSKSRLGELAERAGIENNKLRNWVDFVKQTPGKRLSINLQHWRKELSSDRRKSSQVSDFDNALVNIYRSNVEQSVNRIVFDSAEVAQSTDESEDIVTTGDEKGYQDRKGYDPGFLGIHLPLPTAGPEIMKDLVPAIDGFELRYTHFSVVMKRSRRLGLFAACNIDGKRVVRIARDTLKIDPRIPREQQISKECYGRAPKFNRSRLVQRDMVAWGTQAEARQASRDSLHFTNVVPMVLEAYMGIWRELEVHTLQYARHEDMRMSVFTGPVFRNDDPEMYGVQIPLSYWKIITFIHHETGKPFAAGFTMSQKDLVGKEDPEPVANTVQTSIRSIEQLTGLSFGELSAYDPLNQDDQQQEPLTRVQQIKHLV